MTTIPPQPPPPPPPQQGEYQPPPPPQQPQFQPPQQQFQPPRIYPANPPRDPIVALLLNVFFFCGGYFFIGQMQKGFVGLIVFLGYIAVAVGGGAITGGCATCLVLPIGLAMNAVTAVDGYLQAQQLKLGYPVGEWTFMSRHF